MSLSVTNITAQDEEEIDEKPQKEIDFDTIPGLYDEDGEINPEVLDSLLDEGLFDDDYEYEYYEEEEASPILASSPRDESPVISSSLEEDYADELAFRMKKREALKMKKPTAFINMLNSLSDLISDIIYFLRRTTAGNIVLTGIVITILAFVVYLLRRNKAKVSRKADDEVPPEEMTDEELIRKADLDELLVSAESNGKLKSAFRYRYLILIKKLDQYDVIKWSPALTNDAIRRQINDKNLNSEFRKLTTAYEYLWFGGYPIDDAEYKRLTQVTSEAVNSIETGVKV